MHNCKKTRNFAVEKHSATMNKETNPFVVSGRIPPELFCDRKTESKRLVKLLCNGNNVVLKSDRRMGKTGLVQYCFDQPEIKGKYYTFFVDILHTTCLQELVHELGHAVFEQTVPHGKKTLKRLLKTLRSISGKTGFDVATGLPTFSVGLGDIEQPEYTLEEIFNYLQQADLPCIVAIDEFQQIGKYPEKNIEALLRSHIQQTNNCRFVFAGSEKHMLGLMFDSKSRPFYKSADNLDLLAIPRDIYVEFICQNFSARDRKTETETAARVYDMFEGHTYFVQKTMNEAFANTPVGGNCDWNTVEFSLNTILESNANFYREQLSRMTISQKMLLYAIANDGYATKITSSEFIKRHKLNSASSVQAAIKKLLENELVIESAKQYRISDRFFALWIVKTL